MFSEDGSTTSNFRISEIASVMIIVVVAGAITALQPLLLGQLYTESRITLPQIGQAATLEGLGIAITASLTAALLKPERLRLVGVLAMGVVLAANLLTTQLSGNYVLAVRLVAGVGGGVLVSLWMGLLARAAGPSRLVAILLTVQAVSLLAMSFMLSSVLLPWQGSMAGYGGLAALYAGLILFALPFIPRRYEPLASAGTVVVPDARGFMGLLALLLHLAAVLALWVYIAPIARNAGLSDRSIGFAISFALAMQIAAGLVASVIASRLNGIAMVFVSITVSLACIAVMASTQSNALFIASMGVFTFFWIFAPPFQVAYLNFIDPSRRASLQMVTAQLLGIACGPALAAMAVTPESATGAMAVSAGLFILAALTVAFTVLGARPRKAVTG